MTPRDFVYWLNGLLELGQPETLNKAQIKSIREHLDLVLQKVTPEVGTGSEVKRPSPKEDQPGRTCAGPEGLNDDPSKADEESAEKLAIEIERAIEAMKQGHREWDFGGPLLHPICNPGLYC